jgi:hypothetical protein
VTMGRGWDEGLARTSVFKGWCELRFASSCVSGLRSEVNSHLGGTEEPPKMLLFLGHGASLMVLNGREIQKSGGGASSESHQRRETFYAPVPSKTKIPQKHGT